MSHVERLLRQCRALGITLMPGEDGSLFVTPPGLLSDDLRATLKAYKAEILRRLAEAPHPIAVKVWSDVLNDAIWAIADELPQHERPTDAPVYTHGEITILTGISPEELAWVHIIKQDFGAQVLTNRHRPLGRNA
jgi:hypothetical protein